MVGLKAKVMVFLCLIIPINVGPVGDKAKVCFSEIQTQHKKLSSGIFPSPLPDGVCQNRNRPFLPLAVELLWSFSSRPRPRCEQWAASTGTTAAAPAAKAARRGLAWSIQEGERLLHPPSPGLSSLFPSRHCSSPSVPRLLLQHLHSAFGGLRGGLAESETAHLSHAR